MARPAKHQWTETYEGCYEAVLGGVRVRVNEGGLGWAVTLYSEGGGSTTTCGYDTMGAAKRASHSLVAKHLQREGA